MRCFKGSVMLWVNVVAQMRQHWDERQLPTGVATPKTQRLPDRCVRVEQFDPVWCLIQQKFEMLLSSIAAERTGPLACLWGRRPLAAPVTSKTTSLKLGTGEPLEAPVLLPPALMTEDMVIQRDMASSGISDPAERANLHIKEVRSDMSSFKAANPNGVLADFLMWRSEVMGLFSDTFPLDWLEQCWAESEPLASHEQPRRLFDPEREAEMALHSLENIEGTQLLLQLFRTLLRNTLEDFAETIVKDGSSPHLQSLHEKAVAASLAAFGPAAAKTGQEGDVAAALLGVDAEFPEEELLSEAVSAVDTLESAIRLATSLRAKLTPTCESLVEDLVEEGEVTITSHTQRRAIEGIFERSKILAQRQGREAVDDKGIIESLPLCKEFVFLLQPAALPQHRVDAADTEAPVSSLASTNASRMYAEIRENHLRLAISRSVRVS
eukprot:gnl/TRDRNA2_/TRDRNA2_92620_c0_seq1.p1 gnl/TRDRNA2_/TRDRNA2_92620_c0~~gnl/TRDRNA2_/TRDRNA2_92620_c0_seq1.p1  ORF type:complete len:476 (-),score=100.85 gnl/TRDRNA2_/TRDRNA2_92620_c0_seq1:53-1366(-)